MVWVAFTVLVISSVINWSWVVTRYNTSRFPNPDWYYLNSLDYNKQLLYNIYKRNGMPNTFIKDKVKSGRGAKFLSKKLYYEFVDIQ